MARMPRMSAWVRRVSGYAGSNGATTPSAAMTTTAQITRRPITGPVFSCAAEEPGGPEGQDHGHGCEQREIGKLGKEGFAEVVEKTDDEAAGHGAGQAPEPAHDHHDEGIGQNLGIRAGVHAEEARAHDASQGGER